MALKDPKVRQIQKPRWLIILNTVTALLNWTEDLASPTSFPQETKLLFIQKKQVWYREQELVNSHTGEFKGLVERHI